MFDWLKSNGDHKQSYRQQVLGTPRGVTWGDWQLALGYLMTNSQKSLYAKDREKAAQLMQAQFFVGLLPQKPPPQGSFGSWKVPGSIPAWPVTKDQAVGDMKDICLTPWETLPV